MSKIITIILSDAEEKALNYIAISAEEWIQNVVHHRCKEAMNDIVAQEVERITAIGGSISGTKEDIVLAAPIKLAVESI